LLRNNGTIRIGTIGEQEGGGCREERSKVNSEKEEGGEEGAVQLSLSEKEIRGLVIGVLIYINITKKANQIK
jgi:hypothetical protein